MPREYAKTNFAIWQDPSWRALPYPAQHLYRMLWDHPGLSYCGVVRWRPEVLLGWGAGWTKGDMRALVDCLIARHFIVVDEVTEECLIRSWIRFDGVMKHPKLSVSMTKAFGELGSNALRGVIVHELNKLRDRDPELGAWAKPQVAELLTLPAVDVKSLTVPDDPFASGFAIGLGTGLEDVSGSVSAAFWVKPTSGLGVGLEPPYNSNSNTSTTTLFVRDSSQPADGGGPGEAGTEQKTDKRPRTSEPDESPREDVERICEHLVKRIVDNGGKAPRITKAWRTDMRLFLDRDGYNERQAAWLIDKAHDDSFWRSNILSPASLRKQANQLKMKFLPDSGGPQTDGRPAGELGWGRRRPTPPPESGAQSA